MGAIAEGFVAYAQPLIDQTDGSHEQLQNALTISQLCFNLALVPEDQREATLCEAQQTLKMDDDEFAEFRCSIVDPMIQRHHEMFPLMHRRGSTAPSQSSPPLHARPRTAPPGEKYPGTDRYAPCPCGSGEKYKFCCGKKGR
jgi:hypothetical protein